MMENRQGTLLLTASQAAQHKNQKQQKKKRAAAAQAKQDQDIQDVVAGALANFNVSPKKNPRKGSLNLHQRRASLHNNLNHPFHNLTQNLLPLVILQLAQRFPRKGGGTGQSTHRPSLALTEQPASAPKV